MIFIKNIKLFCFTVLSLVVYMQARSVSYSQIGDVQIVVTDDKWQCDKIECPLDAYRCFVSKSNEEDPSVLKRINYCYSKDNQILAQHISTSPADPNSKIRQQINSTRNGIVSSINGDFDEKKFKENLNHELEQIHTNLDGEMKNLHSNLQQMNENINRNIQNQMQNLETNLSKMQYNLAHMFD